MRKGFLFVLLLLIFGLNLVSSVDVNIKNSVKQGENFIVKVTGKFNKILSEKDIEFKRGTASVEFGRLKVEKIGDDKYFYLTIPTTTVPGNYTMIFKNVEYYSGLDLIKGDIITPFTILNEKVPFTIFPPLIISSDKYTVIIQNLLETSININLEKKEKPEQLKNESIIKEELGFFDILFGKKRIQENITNKTNIVSEIKYITLPSGESINLEYNAPNFKGFEKLNLYYNDEGYGVLVYNPEEVVLQNNNSGKKDIIVENQTGNEKNNITENKTINNETNITEDLTVIKTCDELTGKICVDSEICSGVKENSKDGECCIGKCSPIEKSSSGKLIGWLIIGVISLFLTWFFKNKYKKASPGKIDLIKNSKPKK